MSLSSNRSDDRTVRLWSLRDLKQLDVLSGHQDFVVSLAVTPDGHILYSGDASGTIFMLGLRGATGTSNKLIKPALV